MNFLDLWTFGRTKPVFSFSNSDKLLQFFVKSSIGNELHGEKDYEGENN